MENMTELERKFILMARIANAFKRKGISSSVGYIDDFDACAITVRLSHHKEENYQLEHITSLEISEEQLLEWWSAIDGEE